LVCFSEATAVEEEAEIPILGAEGVAVEEYGVDNVNFFEPVLRCAVSLTEGGDEVEALFFGLDVLEGVFPFV
jgi:hypothetical protein